jgi:hypothetical protein
MNYILDAVELKDDLYILFKDDNANVVKIDMLGDYEHDENRLEYIYKDIKI